MKYAVSISLGSSRRDKRVELELLGEKIIVERRGTDGNFKKAIELFAELDGKVNAFGLGGIDLHVVFGTKRYPLYAAHKLVKHVRYTPVVDGEGLKNTLERQIVRTLTTELGAEYASARVLVTAAVDRFGMASSFFENGYDVVCGDLMFGLGLPIPIRTEKQLKWTARILLPIVGHFPIRVLYPTGDMQDEIVPKFFKWYDWADIIAGDCHYIKRHMPEDLSGKIIVTNSTTETDLELFKQRRVRAVVTTMPQLDGRSFGTNMMEAVLTAVADKHRALTQAEISVLLKELNLQPSIHHFNT